MAALDPVVAVVGTHQEELPVDLSKASEVEVLIQGGVSSLAGHSS